MKSRQRKTLWVPAVVALTALGCQGGTDKTGSTSSAVSGGSSSLVSGENSAAHGELIHVTLKVPNMT